MLQSRYSIEDLFLVIVVFDNTFLSWLLCLFTKYKSKLHTLHLFLRVLCSQI
jgi:hypothetical protein